MPTVLKYPESPVESVPKADKMADAKSDFDPDYLHSLRELVVLLVIFGLAFSWSIYVSFWLGYMPTEDTEVIPEIPLILGMPAWVFWGILIPWLVIDVLAIVFCFGYMKADNAPDQSAEPGLREGSPLFEHQDQHDG
jgi:hypothetical protein